MAQHKEAFAGAQAAGMEVDDQQLAELWHEFWALDTNGDKQVTIAEVKADLMQHHHMSAEEIDATAKKMDKDGDGTIDFCEFMMLMKGEATEQYNFSFSDEDDDDEEDYGNEFEKDEPTGAQASAQDQEAPLAKAQQAPGASLSAADQAALADARKVLAALDLDMDDQTATDLWHEYWALDKDHNGSVEVSEVKKDLMEGHHMSEKEINELLAKTDKNGDGDVSFKEFVAMLNHGGGDHNEYALSGDDSDDSDDLEAMLALTS